MDESKRKEIKEEIEKVVLEALYLGVTEEELMDLLEKLTNTKGGDESHD